MNRTDGTFGRLAPRHGAAVALLLMLATLSLLTGCGRGPDRGVGESCTTNDDCRDRCATGNDFPGGFCTGACFDDADCPPDSICADVAGGVCLFPCAGEATSYCAELLEDTGYECRDRDTPDGRVVLVCLGN